MKRVLPALLLAVVAVAQDDRITFQFRDESAAKVVEVLASFAKVRVVLDEEYAGRTVSLDLKNATLAETLTAMAKELGGETREDETGVHRIRPAWKHKLSALLDRTQLQQVRFTQQSTRTIAQYLRSVLGVGVVIDPALATIAKIDANVDGISARQFLDLVLAQHELVWDLRYGVVFISNRRRLADLPRSIPLRGVRANAVAVGLPFDSTPFPQVVNYLTAATGLRFVIEGKDKDFLEALEISVQASRLTVGQALALTLLPVGATADAKDGVVRIRKR